MKRFILSVLCVALMAPCAWAGGLSAVYTYDGTDVVEASSRLQIEAEREVKFIYELSSVETSEDCSIAFTDGTCASMDTSGDKHVVYTHTFPTSGEVGISMDISGSIKLHSADITEAWPFELNPPKLTMKTGTANQYIKFNTKGSEAVSGWNVDLNYPKTMVQAQYYYDNGLNITPHILVSSLTSEGDATLTVKFTNKADSEKSFERKCFINITGSGSTGGGGGGGGGCSAGLAGLSLLALLPFAVRRKH
ncbi:MAG: SYNERG-CTERM sorting domain-containing protein [Fretibacterium sp.]|nr:SYNERG-CTERM sorting domain-containing protein [Fretibacterium sp.]